MSLPSAFWGFQRIDNKKETGNDEESAGLLPGNGDGANRATNGAYGAINPNDAEESPETREARARMLKKIEESGNWWIYAKSFAVSFPVGFCDSEDELSKFFDLDLLALCLAKQR